ncbi:MAG: nucleotide sugar dehydrogenase [Candidatus Acidiferrales bacterium]
MTRSVSIFGLGYVGAVTAACLAQKGNRVLGVDVNPSKVQTLESGKSPILEPKMDEMIAESSRACRLHATTDPKRAIQETEISFISVGTPSQRNGKLDLGGIEHVCREIGEALRVKNVYHWVVMRSTVLPGTTENVVMPILEKASGKRVGPDFAVCFVPEFLREGTAVSDFFEPPFTIVGAAAGCDVTPVRELFEFAPAPIFQTNPATAEMVKYVCNAFHALKVGFVNEIGTLCKELDVDTQAVTEIFTSDTHLNVSTAYLKPGFAFGGSCLPKDLRALTYRAKELDLRLPLLESLLPSNNEHIERAVESVLRTGKKKVGMLGLSFKSGTDDLRESPLVHLAKRLLGEGCQIQIWDANVALGQLIGSNRQFITDVIPHIGSLLHENAREVIANAEVVLLGTKAVDKETLAATLKPGQILIDLVHLDKKARLTGHERYEGICW